MPATDAGDPRTGLGRATRGRYTCVGAAGAARDERPVPAARRVARRGRRPDYDFSVIVRDAFVVPCPTGVNPPLAASGVHVARREPDRRDDLTASELRELKKQRRRRPSSNRERGSHH